MRNVGRLFAATILALTLGMPIYAGIMDTPTVTTPPPSNPSTAAHSSITSIAISLIVEVLSIP